MFNFLAEELESTVSASEAILYVLIAIVGGLLVLCSIASGIISLVLFFKYSKFNRTRNSLDMTGKDLARKMLDENGLNHIKVSQNGSFIFGNSYSHYFKKIRLRRLTWQKKSVTSVAMASEKVSLALLDKEGDEDMKKRIRLVPLVTFGPLLCIPMIIVGVLLDIMWLGILDGSEVGLPICTIVCTCLGLGFYLLSFLLSLADLKTERKAQQKALKLLKNGNYATNEEIEMCKELYQLYNIEYINNMIMALLELIYNILKIALKILQDSGKFKSSNN